MGDKGLQLQAGTQTYSRAVFMSQRSVLFERVHHPLCFVLCWSLCCRHITSKMNSLKFNIGDICFHISSPHVDRTEYQIFPRGSLLINLRPFVDLRYAVRSLSHPRDQSSVCFLCCLNSYSLKHCNLCIF